jgi:hypothetical protein
MMIKPITYYLSVPIPSEVLAEIEALDFYLRLMLAADLLRISALKGMQNFGACKYYYALLKQRELKAWVINNHYLDIGALANAIGSVSVDIASANEKTKTMLNTLGVE